MSGRVRGLRWLAVAVALGVGVSAAAGAERVALVMGNSRYEHAPSLNNPENDAMINDYLEKLKASAKIEIMNS